MSFQQIIIGRAPDFILKSGQTIFHHKVVLDITPIGKQTYKVTKYHVSMHQLIRSVKEVLDVIGWGNESPVKWNGQIESAASITAKFGVAVISYRLPESLSTLDRHWISVQFYADFRTNLWLKMMER